MIHFFCNVTEYIEYMRLFGRDTCSRFEQIWSHTVNSIQRCPERPRKSQTRGCKKLPTYGSIGASTRTQKRCNTTGASRLRAEDIMISSLHLPSVSIDQMTTSTVRQFRELGFFVAPRPVQSGPIHACGMGRNSATCAPCRKGRPEATTSGLTLVFLKCRNMFIQICVRKPNKRKDTTFCVPRTTTTDRQAQNELTL